MTVTSPSRIKRKIGLVTALLFVAGTLLFFRTGVGSGLLDASHLVSILAASYLIAWGGYALLTRVPRTEIRSQFVLMTLGLGFAFMLAEVPASLGLIDYRQTFGVSSLLPWERPNSVPDRELLTLPKPNQVVKTVFTRGNIGHFACLPTRQAEPFDVKYDKNGFRNEQDLSSADIAVIGDSYVESPMLPAASLMTTHLAALQQKTVANLGQAGFGPQQELGVLKRFGLPLKPDLIIWMFYEGNDLQDAVRYDMNVSFLNSIWDSMNTTWARSFTRNLLWAGVQFSRGCVSDERVAGNYGTVLDGNGRQYRTYFMDHTTTVAPTAQELQGLKMAASTLKTAYELARNQGAEFMVVFVPTKFRVYHDIATFDPDSGGDIEWWVLNDMPERVRRVTSDISADIPFLDLTPTLRAAARERRMIFIPDDTHWTAEGHRLVADTLNAALNNADRQTTPPDSNNPPRITENRTFDFSSDTMMVRNQDGTIRYWSEGAQRMYGWDAETALGAVSHRLLKTVFPVPLEVIEAELLTSGHWEGELIHERRDGSKVRVASRWDLQEDAHARDLAVTVIEVNKVAIADGLPPAG